MTIPNPFKVFGSKSAENVALLGQSHGSVTEQESPSTTVINDVGRVRFDEEESRGILVSSPGFSLRGFTARYAGLNERIVGLVWSNTEIMVGFLVLIAYNQNSIICPKGFTADEQEGKSLTTFAVPFRSRGKIEGVHLLDDEAFVVLGVSALRDTPNRALK